MRVLAITFDSELKGGANRSFLSVVKGLRACYGHEVDVVLPSDGALADALNVDSFDFEVEDLPITGVVLKGEPKDCLRKLKANLLAAKHYFRTVFVAASYKSENYDLVYINGTSQLFGFFLAQRLDLPVVWHFRGYLTSQHYYRFKQTKMFNDPRNNIIVISSSMLRQLPESIGINPEIMTKVSNGLPLPGSREKQSVILGKKINCLQCGRIVETKGHLDAIQALSILKNKGIDGLRLHIVGEPTSPNSNYVNKLKETVMELGLEDSVQFHGQVDDMYSFRESMDFELMCSVNEPFGRVTVEGMRSRLLVIGANTGGTLDIIEDGKTGLLYTQGDCKDLANKMEWAISHEEEVQKIREKGALFAWNHFTEKEMVAGVNAVMQRAKNEFTRRQQIGRE